MITSPCGARSSSEKFINRVTSSARWAAAAIKVGSSFRAIFDYSLSSIYWAMVDFG